MIEIVKPVTKTSTSKAKGNSCEWKVARELGVWMFNDRDMLGRHITSGAIKRVWVGDVIPQKQLPHTFNNGQFPFFIEVKNGYKNNIPNLNNQTIIRQWLSKARTETNDVQNIIYLVASFHAYSPLLITDTPFNIHANLVLNLFDNGGIIPFFIYEYRKILEHSFYSLYENNQYLLEKLSKKEPSSNNLVL